jgi:sterol desaturase/sphingolipid hydroxylase (fatty acid hydroxylase superfamily)
VAVLLEWIRTRSILEAAVLSLLVNLATFVGALAIGAGLVRLFRRRPVAAPPDAVGKGELVLAATCVFLNALVMEVGWLLFRAGALHVDADARPGRVIVDAMILLLAMDLAMYVTHRIAHLPVAFRYVHRVHHHYDRVRPLTLFVLHPGEVIGFGGLWIGVLACHAFSLGGILAYLIINAIFGVLGHLGVEPMPPRWLAWPIARSLGSSTFHAGHHRDPTGNFGFYTQLWDRLLRTHATR